MTIVFNKPFMTGRELHYISQAHLNSVLAGDGVFTRKCQSWLESNIGAQKALLTHSCTAALEMIAILAAIEPGDELIMPSYTFVSTANAFVLRGAVPVFVDIREDTLNIDETKIEAAITPKTRAIVVVHYAGVGCEMDSILRIAEKHNLMVIEDAAQAIMATYKDRPLGSIGHMAALSFHETKNLISGEGGALLLNSAPLVERAEIIREKGTNRSRFFRGQTDKYTWVDIGSSFLPGELISAFLWAQMEEAVSITARRLAIWDQYHLAFQDAENKGLIRRPIVPAACRHNAHMYYLLLPDLARRTRFIDKLRENQINAVFHYVPLHSSPAGSKYGRYPDSLPVTDSIAERLVRLPMWIGLESEQPYVIEKILQVLHSL
jgi:dTDP-4-amino-4,6-dideoxygalactose transaminase